MQDPVISPQATADKPGRWRSPREHRSGAYSTYVSTGAQLAGLENARSGDFASSNGRQAGPMAKSARAPERSVFDIREHRSAARTQPAARIVGRWCIEGRKSLS